MDLISSLLVAACILIVGLGAALITPPPGPDDSTSGPPGSDGRAVAFLVGAACVAAFGVAIGAMMGSDIEPLLVAAAPMIALVATVVALRETWFGVGASPSALHRGLVFAALSVLVSLVAVVALFGVVFATCAGLGMSQ